VPIPSVVLDTNVLISSLWRGQCWNVVRCWRDGRVILAVSADVLEEYLEVLSRFVNPILLQEWNEALTDPSQVAMVETVERVHVILDDPSDNRFLECALAAALLIKTTNRPTCPPVYK
jgi:putative PIN family toxin of toxin-antitoxin system